MNGDFNNGYSLSFNQDENNNNIIGKNQNFYNLSNRDKETQKNINSMQPNNMIKNVHKDFMSETNFGIPDIYTGQRSFEVLKNQGKSPEINFGISKKDNSLFNSTLNSLKHSFEDPITNNRNY